MQSHTITDTASPRYRLRSEDRLRHDPCRRRPTEARLGGCPHDRMAQALAPAVPPVGDPLRRFAVMVTQSSSPCRSNTPSRAQAAAVPSVRERRVGRASLRPARRRLILLGAILLWPGRARRHTKRHRVSGREHPERCGTRLLDRRGRGSLPLAGRVGRRLGVVLRVGVRRHVRADYTVLSPVVCAGALGMGSPEVPAWQQALGGLVLTHEAFHLRHWRFRRSEAKVESQALANFRDAVRRLGATAAQAEELYPYALALHDYKVKLFPQYRDPKCVIPPRLRRRRLADTA